MGLAAYLRELKSKPDMSEVGMYVPFARHIVEDVLRYDPGSYQIAKSPEQTTPDLRLFGEDKAAWVVAEIKLDDGHIRDARRRRKLWREQIEEQRYIRPDTIYVLLAARHTVYVCALDGTVVAGAEFDQDYLRDVVSGAQRPPTDQALRDALHLITAEEGHSRSRYARFRAGDLPTGYIPLDDTSLPQFEETFHSATERMLAYARQAWDRLRSEYHYSVTPRPASERPLRLGRCEREAGAGGFGGSRRSGRGRC